MAIHTFMHGDILVIEGIITPASPVQINEIRIEWILTDTSVNPNVRIPTPGMGTGPNGDPETIELNTNQFTRRNPTDTVKNIKVELMVYDTTINPQSILTQEEEDIQINYPPLATPRITIHTVNNNPVVTGARVPLMLDSPTTFNGTINEPSLIEDLVWYIENKTTRQRAPLGNSSTLNFTFPAANYPNGEYTLFLTGIERGSRNPTTPEGRILKDRGNIVYDYISLVFGGLIIPPEFKPDIDELHRIIAEQERVLKELQTTITAESGKVITARDTTRINSLVAEFGRLDRDLSAVLARIERRANALPPSQLRQGILDLHNEIDHFNLEFWITDKILEHIRRNKWDLAQATIDGALESRTPGAPRREGGMFTYRKEKANELIV